MRIRSIQSSPAAALLGATACIALASPAFAQDGMRYLSWSGKPANAAMPTPPQLQPVSTGRYPSIASAGGRPSRYSPSVASGSLTPANAWMNTPAMAPSPQPAPQPSMPPPAYAQPQAYGQPQGFSDQGFPQGIPVQVPQTALSAGPIYNPPAYSPQPMPGPRYQQQQNQLRQAQDQSQPTAGPAWTQPGYAPQVYGPAASPQVQIQGQAPIQYPAQVQYPAQGPYPAQAAPPPQVQRPPQAAPVQQQAYAGPSTVTGPGWASPQPASAGAPVADPLAPRRDAPIFSIQSAQGSAPSQVMVQPPQSRPQVPSTQQVSASQGRVQAQIQGQPQGQAQQMVSAESPSRGGARYYSVHRAAGHEPDPTAMPESVYAVIPEGAFLDAARTDLADPPAPPIQTRTINGRVQAINQGADPSLP